MLAFFFLNSCAADRPQRADGLTVPATGKLPSCLWSGNIPISPRFAPSDFCSRCKFSTLTTRQLMVMVELSATYGVLYYLSQIKNHSLDKNQTHDFRTTACINIDYARLPLDHSGDEGTQRLHPNTSIQKY